MWTFSSAYPVKKEDATWAGPGPAFAPTDGAAYGFNGSCSDGSGWEGTCGMTGPEEQYEEFKRVFEQLTARFAPHLHRLRPQARLAATKACPFHQSKCVPRRMPAAAGGNVL